MNIETAAEILYGKPAQEPQHPPQSLQVFPKGNAWQIVPPPRSESIEAILARLIASTEEMAKVIASIQSELERR